MLVNDELYFQTFCRLLEAVVEAGGVEASVERLQKNHFYFLSRKINAHSNAECNIQPATIRDYRYIYKREKKFSVRQNRLDLMCDFLGYNGWYDFRSNHFSVPDNNQQSNDQVTLLILPDKRFGAVQQFEGQIGELICNRYEELKEELGADDLEIIYQADLKSLPTGIKGMREYGEANKADIVIWTEYLHGKTPMMRVPSLLVDTNREGFKKIKQPYQDAAELVNLPTGALLKETDIILFQLLGALAYEKGEIERAIEYFEHVLQLEPTCKEALSFMSQLLDLEEASNQSSTLVEETTRIDEQLIDQEMEVLNADLNEPDETVLKALSLSNNVMNTNLSVTQSPTAHRSASLENHLLILKGDNRVLKVKDLEPLIRNTFIHEDETIIFLTRKTDLELLSMNDLTVFKLEASQQEIPIKEALVSINQWHQETKEPPNDNDQSPLPRYSSIDLKQTNKETFTKDLIGIIILPNASKQLHPSQQLEAS